MKNIFLFCCQNAKISAQIAQELYVQQSCIINPQLISSIYTECKNNLSCEQDLCFYSAFEMWVQAIQPFFSAAVTQEVLDNDAEDIIIISPENYQFISCWRELCALRNDKLRVIHIRNFSWLHEEQDEDARQEFQSAIHVALQAGTDTYCFTKEDIETLGDTAAQWLMGRSGVPHPALFLSRRTSQKIINDKFPREIQLINTLFTGATLGAKFVLDINIFSHDDLKYLKSAAHPASALELYWQNKKSLPNESLSFMRTEQRIMSLFQALQQTRKKASLIDRLREELNACSKNYLNINDIYTFLDGAPSSTPLREKAVQRSPSKAASQDIKKKSKQQIQGSAPSQPSAPKISRKPTKNSLLRKFRKLKRDPHAFFRDSKYPVVRFLEKFIGKSK